MENIELEVTVNKADGGNLKTVELEQKYTDASDHTYTPDWAGLPAGQDWTFSSEASIVLPKQDFAADGNLLTYAIAGGKAGDKITLILKASCDNYEDFTITLNVTLTEKDDQKPLTITGNTSVIYGEKLTLTTTGGSGMGAVTLSLIHICVIRGVRVLLLQLDRFEVAAICLVHRDFKFNVLHCVVVFGVLRM